MIIDQVLPVTLSFLLTNLNQLSSQPPDPKGPFVAAADMILVSNKL